MPYLLDPNAETRSSDTNVEYDYDYPEGLDLRPKSEVHKELKRFILTRAIESHGHVSKRFDSWKKVDRTLTAYIEPSAEEETEKSKDKNKPISIVFPYSYAVLETLLSYMSSAFLSDPIFRYEYVSPEDAVGAIMLEKVIEHHCIRNKVGLALHTFFRDCLAYGIGVCIPGWDVHRGIKRRRIQGQFGAQVIDSEEILYEGNSLTTVDPYLYLPDPNVSIHDCQKGEYVGWVEKTNLMELLSLEQHNEDFFNVQYLKHSKATSRFTTDNSDRQARFTKESSRERYKDATRPVDVVHLYAKIIPSEMGLGDSDYPEKWLFSLANDEFVIRARQAGFNHNMFPSAAAAPDFDGYSPLPVSRIEALYGLQHVLDFLFNSHMANVKRAVNDTIVFDPYLISTEDLADPKPGKLVRMRRPAWGRGVKDAVMQLPIQDITRANIADSSFIVQWMQKIGAADDSVMGSLRQGGPERLTGKEFQGTRAGSVSRLERIAKVIGMQALHDIAYMFASNTQQMMTQETYVKTTGRWQDRLVQEFGNVDRMRVTPWQISVDYDIYPRDGSVPGGNFSEAWLQLWDSLAGNPLIAQQFDLPRLFKHIARGLGAKNVDEFMKTTATVMPDEQVAQQVEKGNLVQWSNQQQNLPGTR